MNAMRNGNRNKSRQNAKVRCSAVAARGNSGFSRWDRRVGFEGRAAEFPGLGLRGSELDRVADRTEGQNGERRKRQRGKRPASAAVAPEDADIHVSHPNRMNDAGLPFLTQVKQPRWPVERSVRRFDSHDEQRTGEQHYGKSFPHVRAPFVLTMDLNDSGSRSFWPPTLSS